MMRVMTLLYATAALVAVKLAFMIITAVASARGRRKNLPLPPTHPRLPPAVAAALPVPGDEIDLAAIAREATARFEA